MAQCQVNRVPHPANKVRYPANIHPRHLPEATRAKARATKEVNPREFRAPRATASRPRDIKLTASSKRVSMGVPRRRLRRGGGLERDNLFFFTSVVFDEQYSLRCMNLEETVLKATAYWIGLWGMRPQFNHYFL